MRVVLSVTAGPFLGREFSFDGHDTFLVGRVNDAHLQLSYDDPYFSRRHFVLEINPPRCRLLDLKSRNGTQVNGQVVSVADILDGDVIKAGHTIFKVALVPDNPEEQITRVDDAAAPEPALIPTVDYAPAVPGYAVGQEIGRGGMGMVFRAQRLSDGLPVAIKTVIPSRAASSKQIERFVREASILQQLHHPNVVGFLEVGILDDGVIFLVMEQVNGTDARRLLESKGPLSIPTAVRIVCQMLAGLHHAHEQGFVHRDVKPANLLIHAQGSRKVTKLADFGLARAYEASRLSGLTLQGEVGGTPAFMAPEQVTHYRDAKPAADQYAAAATLYNLLTKKYIHDLPVGTPQQLIHLSTEPPVPILSRRGDVPPGLAAVIHTALNREPVERYPDVESFRAELKRWA